MYQITNSNDRETHTLTHTHTHTHIYIYIYIYIYTHEFTSSCRFWRGYSKLVWFECYMIACWWTQTMYAIKKFLKKVKLATIVEGNSKAPFSIATTPMCRGGRYSFPGLLYFTLDPYLIMLSVKQGGIKYHFLSLWYDSTWDWTQVSRAIGEHSNP